jgi:hypothetical protein
MNHFDPKRIVGLIASLPASGLESGNPHTAITLSLELPAQPCATSGAIHLLVDSSGLKLGGVAG